MARLKFYARNIPGGTGINGAAWTITRPSDSSTIASGTTDANGLGTWSQDGSPGTLLLAITSGGQTKYRSGAEEFQVGPWFISDFPTYERRWSDGVISGYNNGLAVGVPGGTMQVQVATGAATVRGILYEATATTVLAISTADPTNPRIDRVVITVIPPGNTDEGKATLSVLTGTPSPSPSPPALTQGSTSWQISLAQVRVNAGVTAITAGNLTDERPFTAPVIPNGAITNAMLAAGGAFPNPMTTPGDLIVGGPGGAAARLGIGSNGQIPEVVSGALAYVTPPWMTDPMTAAGDLAYHNGSNVLARLPAGSNNQVFMMASGLPSWQNLLYTSNPVVQGYAETDGVVSGTHNITVTSPTTFISGNVTLLAGVTYDLAVWGAASMLAGNTWVRIRASWNGNNAGGIGHTDGTTYHFMPDVLTLTNVAGTGAATTFGMQGWVDAGTGGWRSAVCSFVAIPRS